jgi:AcrR family transcriptional regulator
MPKTTRQNSNRRGRQTAVDTRAREKGPASEKGKRTRERILKAAERVFERDGFLAARVADIAAEAGVAHGSFYTYFDSKEDVFREAASAVVNEIYEALDVAASGQPARELIRAANVAFLDLYERHALMLGLIEQVATFDDHFREMRLALRHRLVRRVERALAGMTEHGETHVDGLDQRVLANALAGMVDNFAYAWFILKEPFNASAVETLDELWIRALGITDG